eukprot:TRINITY_DN10989_c0_g1_i4.p1 TRINITY_DN10989_c0_g1~~TRINITY_DN10989_c0_g1_i4.p1  ORF type:complete len:367 (-),score=67.90 TRINITY_DN10989_c0_g1_i4:93-1193(-)
MSCFLLMIRRPPKSTLSSSSAASDVYKRQEWGWDAHGIHMQNWDVKDEDPNDTGCTAMDDSIDAQRVCEALEMPFHQVSFQKEYWNRVFTPMLERYEAGEVPNPDVWCNREVKFDALLKHVKSKGFTHLATGHYARTRIDPITNTTQLLCGSDPAKDQSYFLASVPGSALADVVFPLGEVTKADTRKLAKQAQLRTAHKRESMGICFVGKKKKFGDFLLEYIGENPGNFVEASTGRVLGKHKSAAQYTVGQNARIGGLGHKFYVVSKDMNTGDVHLGPADSAALNATDLIASQLFWVAGNAPDWSQNDSFSCKFRHGMSSVPVRVQSRGSQLQVKFESPQRGIQPGQVVALYDGEVCFGGGVITQN